ncbi:MAG: EpsD family peptidyl-prolyl cis-trans isomerase [Thiobacillaceae bacterium]|jgi:EpsD family peptidyl-prolyl cis-trans isomerase|nr:EpsD family peptidyl-prolyl cis-trans isomerase [Thiobacillaceae bacterium]
MKSRYAPLIALTAIAILLAGCEKPTTAVKSEMVASVGDEKISEAELNLTLARLGELSEAQTAEAKGKLLQALVDQRLIAQAAQKAGLDKEPAVEIAMANASRQVLAEAYAERTFKDVAKPSDTEIAEYYEQHPELFSERRIYRIQELDLQVDASRMADVEAKLRTSHSLGDFVNWVKEQGIEGKTAVAVKPAEQIPAALLARLSQMKDGQVALLPGRPGHVVIQQLQESQLQPVTLEQSRNAIERALTTQKRKELMEADLKKLRAAAKIEYATGYAPAAEAKVEAAETQVEEESVDKKEETNGAKAEQKPAE